MTSSAPRPQPGEVARVTAEAAELLEILWGRASTAPVSTPQLRVLFVLERDEGINLRTLAEALGSTPPSTSRLCDRLQAVGFIERVPGAISRRELRLFLSARGRTFLTELRARREHAVEAVLGQMPAGDRTALVKGLAAFCAAAAAQLREGDAMNARSA